MRNRSTPDIYKARGKNINISSQYPTSFPPSPDPLPSSMIRDLGHICVYYPVHTSKLYPHFSHQTTTPENQENSHLWKSPLLGRQTQGRGPCKPWKQTEQGILSFKEPRVWSRRNRQEFWVGTSPWPFEVPAL